jgi:hypothetical protein
MNDERLFHFLFSALCAYCLRDDLNERHLYALADAMTKDIASDAWDGTRTFKYLDSLPD